MTQTAVQLPTVKDIIGATHYRPRYRAEAPMRFRVVEGSYPRRVALGFVWDHMESILPDQQVEAINALGLREFDEEKIAEVVSSWAKESGWDYDALIINLADASLVKDDTKLPETSPNREIQSKADPTYINPVRKDDTKQAVEDALIKLGLSTDGTDEIYAAVLDALTS